MEKLIKRKDVLLSLFLFLLALTIRLYRIDAYLTFLGDEGRDALVVYNILHGHFTLLGPTSSVGGFFLGPIYYYFMAPFLLLFNYSPVGPAVMIALLGAITVLLIRKIGTEFFGATAGLIAALLYATSPLVVTYSRSSWNPNGMPFFTLVTLYVLYKAITQNNRILFILSGFLFGIVLQLHYLGVFVGAIIIIYDVLTRLLTPKNPLTERLVSILKDGVSILVGFLIGFSPFLLFEARHGFLNSKNIYQFIFHSKEVASGGNFFFIIYNVFLNVFGRLITNFPSIDKFDRYTESLLRGWEIVTILIGIVSIFFLLKGLMTAVKKHDTQVKARYLLLLIWLFVGVGLFGFYKKSIYDYYLEFLFPVPFLLIGYDFSYLFSRERLQQFFAGCLLAVLLLLNIRMLPIYDDPNRQLAQTQEIAKFLIDKTGGKPYNFALITGSNSDHAYRYFFTVWNRPPVTIENPGVDPQRKTVTDQLFVICESLPCAPLGNSLWEVAGFGRAEIAGHWSVSVVEIYKLVHYKGPQQ